MPVDVYSVAHPELPPLRLSDRFRHEITYFMSASGEAGVPALAAGEYWVRRSDAETFLDEGVVRIVSPLDSASRAEIELTEEQEQWLEWMLAHQIEHVRIAQVR